MEVEYATKGKANAALTTGIIGTVGTGLGLLGANGGLLGNLFGGNCKKENKDNSAGLVSNGISLLGTMLNNSCHCGSGSNSVVTRYDQELNDKYNAAMTEIAMLKSNIYNDQKSLEMYQYVDGRLRVIESQICQQNVVNAQLTANISCMQNAINTLSGLTKTVIPINNVCPEPMPMYNSWTAPTAPTTTTG